MATALKYYCTPIFICFLIISFGGCDPIQIEEDQEDNLLIVSAESIDFVDVEEIRIIRLSNSGGGSIEYTVTVQNDWLEVSPRSGSVSNEVDTLSIEIINKNLSPGSHSNEIKINHSVGSEPYIISVIIEIPESDGSPLARFTVTPSEGSIETEFQFNASQSSDNEDSNAVLLFRWKFEGGTSFTEWLSNPNATHKYSALGTKTITLNVRDTAGNVSETMKTVSVIEAPNAAPTAAFTVNPESGQVGTLFSFDASTSSDAEDGFSSLEFRWDLDIGSGFGGWTNEHVITHTYNDPGTRTITLEVRDTNANISEAKKNITVTENPNDPPTAAFTVTPSTGDINTVFQFDASASSDPDDDLSQLEFRWEAESGGGFTTWMTSPTYSHSYSESGTKTIVLEVKDSASQTDSEQKSVMVSPVSFEEIEPNNSKDVANLAEIESLITGFIGIGDDEIDNFRLQLPSHGSYKFRYMNTAPEGTSSALLFLMSLEDEDDSTIRSLCCSYPPGSTSRETELTHLNPDNEYYLVVEQGGNNSTSYLIMPTFIPAPHSDVGENNDTFDTAHIIEQSSTTNALVGYGENIDHYRVNPSQNGTLTITIRNTSLFSDDDSGRIVYFRVYNSEETRIAQVLDTLESPGSSETISLTVGSNTFYYLQIYGFGAAYQIQLSISN